VTRGRLARGVGIALILIAESTKHVIKLTNHLGNPGKILTNRLGEAEQNLMIIPGMIAGVDILTGKKSVLQYLLKPTNKARFEALLER
jgi:hypothetical protein